MDRVEELARERARSDEEVRLAAHLWIATHFGGDRYRAAIFFDELAKEQL